MIILCIDIEIIRTMMFELLLDIRHIFSFSVILCNTFVLIPIALYYFKRFYNSRQHVSIVKRHWKLIAAQMLCTVLWLLVERPLAVFLMNHTLFNANYIYFVDRFLYVCILHTNLHVILVRFWIIHYDINFTLRDFTVLIWRL